MDTADHAARNGLANMGDVAYTLTLIALLGGGIAVARIAVWVRGRITHHDTRTLR